MTIQPQPSSNFNEFATLLGGAIAGFLLAWWLHGFGFSNPGELEAARETGIVSLTVLEGYPKSRDIYNYLITLLLPVIGAIVFQQIARARSPLGSRLANSGFSTNAFSQIAYWPTICAIVLWSWHTALLMAPGWNPHVGAWPFLGEQGATLDWSQNLASGGVFGRDFFSLYGPMFVYPLHWLMDLTGNHSALMDRYYKILLQSMAFGLLIFVFLRTLRSRVVAWIFATTVVFIYPALVGTSANSNNLRTALALFALASLALWIDTRQMKWRWIGGLTLGQSFLFSQEAALCAFCAGSVIVFLDELARTGRRIGALRAVGVLCALTLLSMSPMLLYLLAKGAGAAILDSLIGYPKLVLLGFGAFPFPSLRDWLSEDFMTNWLAYAVIGIYSGSAIALILAWYKGVRSPRLYWSIGLTLFGTVLFRQALGRSDADQIIKVMLPALFLTAIWLDELWVRAGAGELPGTGLIGAVLGALLLINLVFGIGCNPAVSARIQAGWHIGTSLDGKFRLNPQLARDRIDPRVGFSLDPATRLSVLEIENFLESNTKPGESVYFFPNEAAYYHLFERPNPTRYAISYFATPYDRQREVIRDLERNRPRFVVYSKQTWRIDNIPESVQVPLIVDYLRSKYRLLESLRTVDILQRN